MSDNGPTIRDIVKGLFAIGMAALGFAAIEIAKSDKESAHIFVILAIICFFLSACAGLSWILSHRRTSEENLSIAPHLLPETTPAISAPPVEAKTKTDTSKEPEMPKKKDKASPTPPSPSQTMVNSPGGMQAGRDITINQGPPRRTITNEQRDRFFEVAGRQPKGEINITCALGTPEPCDFARELQSLLTDAGWTVTGLSEMLYVGNPTGLTLLVASPETTPAHAVVLQRSLDAIGFKALGSVMEGKKPHTVTLLVGVNSD